MGVRTQIVIEQRVRQLIIMLLLAPTSTGCGVAVDITRRVVIDQLAYNESADSMVTCARDHILAGCAWDEYRQNNPDMDASYHFECGFRTGFVDHLEVGATEPPVVPPRKYWKVTYQTPQGHEAINDWFSGYRFGVIAAADSGFRELVTIPLSIPPEKIAPGQSAEKPYQSRPSTEPQPEAMLEVAPQSSLVSPESAGSSAVVHRGWRSYNPHRRMESPANSAVRVAGASDWVTVSRDTKDKMDSAADGIPE